MSSTVTQIGQLSNSSSSLASSLAVTGLASGMDWSSVVTALANAERVPEMQWKQQQAALSSQSSAFTTIQGYLATLQTDAQTLQSDSLFGSRTAQTSDASVASAIAGGGTNIGAYSFDVSQLATAAKVNGTSGVNAALSPDGNLANVTIGTAGFATRVTAGVFTINGKTVNIATTDSLQDVFTAISNATNGEVQASYQSDNTKPDFDKITLTDTQGNNLVLGSATDTSNFLQIAKLYNGAASTPAITSSAKLGSVQLTAAMQDADLKTAVHGDTSGPQPSTRGSFAINGVTINYDTSADSLQNVLDRINNSGAGVTVTFDSQNNRFLLANNSTGNVGLALQNVSGNFLDAIGLSGGQVVNGQNLLYTLNGGSQQLTSLSNTISGDSSGINGLTVTALKTGSFSVTVASDTTKISSAIQQFVTDYNTAQSFISNQMAVTNNPDGTVTPGLLAGDMTASGIASSLRSLAFSSVPSNAIGILSNLGITSNGKTNNVTLDSNALQNALADNFNAVQSFFTDSQNGLATQLLNYLNDTIGGANSTTPGALTQHQTGLSTRNSEITSQIKNLETKIASDSAHWTSEFQAMEQAQAKVNQELTYLSQNVSSGAL